MSSTADGAMHTTGAGRWLVLYDAEPGTDSIAEPDAEHVDVVRASWSVSVPPSGIESIPALAEQHALSIRAEYLAWIDGMAHADLGGQSVEAALRCRISGLSFWHMTLIAEKSPMKSAGIHLIFKLRALEILHTVSNCHGLAYHGNNRMLARMLERWMGELGLPFRHPATTASAFATPRRLARMVSAWAFLARKLWLEVGPARRTARNCAGSVGGVKPLNVFTYFPNFDATAAAAGTFRSRYWEALHDLFSRSARPINWIWIYSGTGDASYREALAHADRFSAQRLECHLPLEQFATWQTVARTLRRYLRLLAAAVTLPPPRAAFRLPGSAIEFFPVLESEWHESLLGSTAMANAWNATIHEAVAAQLPQAAATLYPCENHPWEYAMLHALRARGHGTLIGHQHGLPAPLNLRYLPLPGGAIPDWLVVGGPWPRAITLAGGAAPERVVVCEAVRYQYLAQLPRHTAGGRNLLVITSLLENETLQQLTLVAKAYRDGGLRQFDQITVKPHPFRAVDRVLAALGVEAHFNISAQPLAQLWPSAAAAVVANSTGAGMDALYAGVPFVICSAGDMMNLNPLFSNTGIKSVSTPGELDDALQVARPPGTALDHLCLDPALPRWRAFLAQQGVLASSS